MKIHIKSAGLALACLFCVGILESAETKAADNLGSTPTGAQSEYCKEAYETGNMPGMTDCENEALQAEDRRLNREYKAVMAELDKAQQKQLRNKQRAWIKARDKACKMEEDGGQAAILNNVSCLHEWTKKRADALAAMK